MGKGSIIHFQHFREWRLNGVAYELRDIVYKEANRSLLSTAYGRTKEFKDRYSQTQCLVTASSHAFTLAVAWWDAT